MKQTMQKNQILFIGLFFEPFGLFYFFLFGLCQYTQKSYNVLFEYLGLAVRFHAQNKLNRPA